MPPPSSGFTITPTLGRRLGVSEYIIINKPIIKCEKHHALNVERDFKETGVEKS